MDWIGLNMIKYKSRELEVKSVRSKIRTKLICSINYYFCSALIVLCGSSFITRTYIINFLVIKSHLGNENFNCLKIFKAKIFCILNIKL